MTPHPVRLRAPAFLGGGDAPVVVRITDQRFVPRLFADLRDPDARRALADRALPIGATDNTLYLPVHRTYNVVLAEAYCDVPGTPRVDPRRLESMGLVVRRRPSGRRAAVGPAAERWIVEDETVLGWRAADGRSLDEDPEPVRRPRRSAGHPAVDRALLARRGPQRSTAEHVARLYAAPRDVCEAARATLVFGMVDAASPQKVERRPTGVDGTAPPPAGYSDTELRSMMPAWLRERPTPAPVPPELRGRTFEVVDVGSGDLLDLRIRGRTGSGAWADFDAPPAWTPLGADVQGSTLTDARHFLRMLSQLQLQWDVWGAGGSSLEAALRGTPVRLADGADTDLAAFLRQAARVFVLMETGERVTFPESWPAVSAADAGRLQGAVGEALSARVRQLAQHEGRFDRPEARYQVRCFVRVRQEDGCPPKLVWSEATPDYRVARWHEGGPDGAVLPTIELPSIDRDFLKKLRPNVSVKVPRGLFNFLQNNTPEDLLAGKAKNDTSGPDFLWICGLNLSIIFVIAYVLLITFVFLLNLVFWWVPFFRICIPLPAGLAASDEEA